MSLIHPVPLDIRFTGALYISKSTKAIRHHLYKRGWKQNANGSWRSNYSPLGFGNVNDVLRFDAQLRKGLTPNDAYKAVHKFTFEKTQKEIDKRRSEN
jgi:hypothetical protein